MGCCNGDGILTWNSRKSAKECLSNLHACCRDQDSTSKLEIYDLIFLGRTRVIKFYQYLDISRAKGI